MTASFRIPDLNVFLTVHRLGSVTAAARQLGVAPSQVSKAIARLERALGARLLLRSSRGMALSEKGVLLLPRLDDVLRLVQQLLGQKEEEAPMVTLAAPSYLCALLAPAVAEALRAFRLRALEMPPSMVRTLASTNLFDATILLGEPGLPDTWVATEVGTTRKILLASPQTALALGAQPVPVEKLAEAQFITPFYAMNGQYVPVDDDCPLPAGARRSGHEMQTIVAALEMAVHTTQLVFAPELAAFRHLFDGSLIEVRVRGWDLQEGIYLACHVDRVLARVQACMVSALRDGVRRFEYRANGC